VKWRGEEMIVPSPWPFIPQVDHHFYNAQGFPCTSILHHANMFLHIGVDALPRLSTTLHASNTTCA